MLIDVPLGAVAESFVLVPATVTTMLFVVRVTTAFVLMPLMYTDVSEAGFFFRAVAIADVLPSLMPWI